MTTILTHPLQVFLIGADTSDRARSFLPFRHTRKRPQKSSLSRP